MTFNYPSKLCTRLNTEKAFFFFINLEGHGSTQRQEGPAFMHRQMGAETGEELIPTGQQVLPNRLTLPRALSLSLLWQKLIRMFLFNLLVQQQNLIR